MNKAEALEILATELARFREKPYSELVSLIDRDFNPSEERTAPSGRLYCVELQVFWDDKPGGDVRVMGSVDDGGWRAIFPLSDDFIKSPSGAFVGE